MVDIIKKLCEQRGISINKLEMESKIGKNSIARWDTNRPSIEKVKAVADYFGVSVDYLLGSTKEDLLQNAFDQRPEMRILFDAYKDASKEDIEQAIKIIEALKK